MKKAVTLCALLLSLPLVSHAGVELGVDVPGLSLHIGDQDRRGYYWDGDDWRDPHWWHHHHRHHEDGRWVWVEEPDEDVPPPRWHEPPPPPRWHDDWHDGPPPHWHHHDRDDW
ncbi:hypothetical protein CYR32_14650 [Chimaeribacter coloradensis]|uniref:DUF2502 domain-containing protein n=2 Tax=Chimaeribacter coloradensis TaxID=2060068 RepID=A0A2N5DZ51_9GAMM|nr:DUF2502 domain-containing protein [Chimaeribacter coloradensis]PLR32910.1 hypothetical protein CYR32_14650 [Chimaeribacter coloradensis]